MDCTFPAASPATLSPDIEVVIVPTRAEIEWAQKELNFVLSILDSIGPGEKDPGAVEYLNTIETILQRANEAYRPLVIASLGETLKRARIRLTAHASSLDLWVSVVRLSSDSDDLPDIPSRFIDDDKDGLEDDEELMALADEALLAQDARKDEKPEEWATRVVKDFIHFES